MATKYNYRDLGARTRARTNFKKLVSYDMHCNDALDEMRDIGESVAEYFTKIGRELSEHGESNFAVKLYR